MALFDCDPKLIRTLMREQHVGTRDVTVKPKVIGPNEITMVSPKSMRGVEFVKKLEEKITKLTLSYDPDDDEYDEDDEDEDLEEEQEDEELEEEEEEEDDELAED